MSAPNGWLAFAFEIEQKYGHCCGDMLNISAADLAIELERVAPSLPSQAVPRYRYIPHVDGGFVIEERQDVKDNGVWLDYFWQDTGDFCETEDEAKAYIKNAIEQEGQS